MYHISNRASHSAPWGKRVDNHPLHEIHRRFRRVCVGVICAQRKSTRLIDLLVQLGSLFLSAVGCQSFLRVSGGHIQLRLSIENRSEA